MICRRRRNRSGVFIGLIFLVIAGFIFLKSKVCLINCEDETPLKYVDSSDKNEDDNVYNDQTLQELERLKLLDKRSNNEKMIEQELLKKREESLKEEKEKEDPFFVDSEKEKYVDFQNFKTDFKETDYKPEDLKPIIGDLNARQIMHNGDKFSNTSKDHIVIVVQVHKRVEYFKELLDSLQRAKGIENAVLVVSHDFYSDTMNELIRRINFCKVIQIFFPYSLQLYPYEYPGQSPEDCPRDMKKSEALQQGCLNAEHPDQYGHYREAHITMTKHHWWWKLNMVMDEIEATRHHDGPFMLVEEDHYVTPSFYDAMMRLHHIKQNDKRCRGSCEILTLGNYSNKDDFQNDGDKVFLGTWISSQHNMGMAFYRDTWEKIKRCAPEFCVYDDYNWDWTLMHLSLTCIDKPFTVLVYIVPRMFHVGDCGLHHTKRCDDPKESINKVKGLIKRQKPYLYHEKLTLLKMEPGAPALKPNGGWGDTRDQEMCKSFVNTNRNGLMMQMR